MAHHPATPLLDQGREDRILGALASLRHDVMDEIMKMRFALNIALDRSLIMTSQRGRYSFCDDVNLEPEACAPHGQSPTKDDVVSDVDDHCDDASSSYDAGLSNQCRQLTAKLTSLSNLPPVDAPRPIPLLRRPDYDVHSEVLYGSATMADVKEERPCFNDVVTSRDVTKALRTRHNPDTSNEDCPGQSSPTSRHGAIVPRKGLLERISASSAESNLEDVGEGVSPNPVAPNHPLSSYVFGAPGQISLSATTHASFANLKHPPWKGEGTGEFNCRVCHKTYSSHSSFARHKRTHTKEKCFQCKTCNKVFPSRSSYVMHERIHTGEKPFHCDVCGKSFSAHSNLKVHKRTHTGEKPYVCDVCDKQFSCVTNLKVHRRTHTGEKPYQCEMCPRHFSRLSYLQHHKQNTHSSREALAIDTS